MSISPFLASLRDWGNPRNSSHPATTTGWTYPDNAGWKARNSHFEINRALTPILEGKI
ncbi:MAG: hypothetical protein ACK552_12725 [Microcystis sp.]|uniref:hypothetical protein n=1 Tax=Microcystis aeruginosa TaxID=1126 RepID=UPI0022463AC5|nr:hypothetical protein [Microcystis aeruginosa]UZO79132.1 hypothetical protein M8120_08415 [Microcystis aeruginosa str. Chao 1910]